MSTSDCSDREIFAALPFSDTWDDADLFTVFTYLWDSSATSIPESWLDTMTQFQAEFKNAVVGDQNLVAEYNSVRHGF